MQLPAGYILQTSQPSFTDTTLQSSTAPSLQNTIQTNTTTQSIQPQLSAQVKIIDAEIVDIKILFLNI